MKKQSKSTLLFVCFLLLGGICHVTDVIIHRADDLFTSTWMFCADLMIYSGLILFWLQSVRRRLLPSHARNYLLASGALMLLFLLLRTVKYRIVQWSTPMERYCWYGYYVPTILVPTFFLMTAFYFGNKPEQHSRIKRYPLILGIILTLGVLTNDLHNLAFRFKTNPETNAFYGKTGTYTHGVLFYAAYIWAGCMITAGIVHLISVSRKMKDWKPAIRPFLCMLLFLPVTFLNNRLGAAGLPQPFLMPEILIFCLIGVLEFSIRNHLLPHNEYYDTVFSKLELPVSITDKAFAPVYQTQVPVTANKEKMQQAVGSSVYPEPDMRLSGMALDAGYAFFAEDESTLHRLNAELRDANEVLSMENELLAREKELSAEKAAIEERNALYTKAARAVYPAQKRISSLLEAAEPETPAFRMQMARILFMTAYVKRKANFVMLEADQGAISAEELTAAIKESIHYLSYCGIHTAARITTEHSFSCEKAMAVYDCFEAAAEALCGNTEEIWVRLTDGELMIMADTEKAPALPEMPLPTVCSHEDGQTVIRVQTGGDAS